MLFTVLGEIVLLSWDYFFSGEFSRPSPSHEGITVYFCRIDFELVLVVRFEPHQIYMPVSRVRKSYVGIVMWMMRAGSNSIWAKST